MPAGRPTGYREEYASQAEKLCSSFGATDAQLAEFFGVSTATIKNWYGDFPDFLAAVKKNKAAADEGVERRLFERATGYTFDAVKIFMPAGAVNPVYAPYVEHVPPDPTSMIFWLKNRQPARWREKQEVEHSGSVTLESLVTEAAAIKEKGPKSD